MSAVNIQAVISMITLVFSWFFAQFPFIENGFDQLFSLGLLMTAIVVIWRAFTKKNESENEALRQHIDSLESHIKQLDSVIKELRK